MGLLDMNEDQSNLMMGLGMGLLSASAPSSTRKSFGQTMLGGLQGFQQAAGHNKQRQVDAMQQQMMQMQLDAAKTSAARKKAIEELLPTMTPDVQQAYLLAGPEKAFDMMNQARLMGQFDQALSGSQTAPAPRPFQQSVQESLAAMPNARIVADTPEQQRSLLENYEKMKTKYPQDAERLREQLIQQGLITPPVQQAQGPDFNKLAELSARYQLAGIKGATGMMDLAKYGKPDWQQIDNGGQIQFVNKNGSQMPTINKTLSPGELASNQLGWANNDVSRFNATKPTYHDGALVGPGGEITKTPMYTPPKGSPEATAQASAKITPLLAEADRLLSGSTGSYLGTGADMAAGAVGISTKGARSAAQLKALEGAIMMAQPRMEGPQSDKDVALYRQMAGQIGDSTVPVETRRAALQGIKRLHDAYSGGTASQAPQSTLSSGGWSATVVK